MTKSHEKVISGNPNSTDHYCRAQKTQKINSAVTIVVLTTLFKVQNHKIKVILQQS